MAWKPWLGAVPDTGGTHFRVWAPTAQSLGVKLEHGPLLPLSRDGDGYYTGRAEGVRAGARYFYLFPDGRERPDPASLLQPDGVHGPSEIVEFCTIVTS